MRRIKIIDIYSLSGSFRKSSREPFVFCRFIFLALMLFLYCLPDVAENQNVIVNYSFRTSPGLTITRPDLTDSTDLFDDVPLLCSSSGRTQTFRRPSRSFSQDIADTLSGNLNVFIAVHSSVKYFFKNSGSTSCRYKKCFRVRAGPQFCA